MREEWGLPEPPSLIEDGRRTVPATSTDVDAAPWRPELGRDGPGKAEIGAGDY